jgi:signal transduction histidine kinase
MFHSVAIWYRNWDQELLKVLEDPASAAQARAGLHRWLANKVAKLSPVERHQLRAFSVKYRGARLFVALAKLILLFTLVGAALHFAFPQRELAGMIVRANLVGFVIVWVSTAAWFNYRWLVDQKRKVMIHATVGMTTGVICIASFGLVTGRSVSEILAGLPSGVYAYGFALGLLIVMVPLVIVGTLRNRQYATLTAQLQHEAERERLARELSDSQLLLLRAQIEPHFLFNTLGAVQQLAQDGAPLAAQLTANLIVFLRASLAEMRSEHVTLEQEFAVVKAYLEVMKARLGERLHVTFELPGALAQMTMPSMLVLTLAENAIKHGIEPSLRGGTVAVSARLEGGAACIRVEDSGAGLHPQPGGGIRPGLGLDNVRRRLQLAYGAAASVTLSEGFDGTVAEIIVPNGVAN